MNVWFDNSTKAGYEKVLINHYLESGKWNHVVYEENDSKLLIIQYFEQKMQELESVEYIDSEKYNNIYSHLYEFIDMYSRNSPISQNTYDTKTIHDYLNLFNIAINYYYTRFKKEDIELFIISRAPHIGVDYIKCLVAKEMGIKTLILEQSLLPNRFHYYWDLYDYGNFATSTSLYPISIEPIKKEYEMDLFYIKKNKFIKKAITKIKSYMGVIGVIVKNRCFMAALINLKELIVFNSNRNKLVCDNIDLSNKYVYFAMHLQPEKTTSSWGGEYNDQLLAIERLSVMIPNDWFIYVKENPKQRFFMRGKWFYKRLSMIKNVVVVPNETNTYTLLKNCQFASTITGTVGWEAIKGGKNVLVFGWGVWYKTLPGVFGYEPDLNPLTIANNIIDHSLLEKKFAELVSKMALGVIYKDYDAMVEGFDQTDNVKTLISSFDKILGYNEVE